MSQRQELTEALQEAQYELRLAMAVVDSIKQDVAALESELRDIALPANDGGSIEDYLG